VNLEAQKKLLSQMTPSEQGAIKGIQGLGAEYGKMSRAFEPQAFKIFNDGLKIANHLLPAVTPFANTFANSLDGLLKKADKFTQSKGFGDFLKQFRGIEGPAVTAIGDGIGRVANSIGKLLTSMSGKDVAHTINIAFNAISGAISGVTAVVQGSMVTWDHLSSAAASAFHGIVSSAEGSYHGVMSAWSAMMGFLASVPGKIKGFFAGAGGWLTSAGSSLIHGLEAGAKSYWGFVTGWFSGLVGQITGFFARAGGWLVQAGVSLIHGLISGMQSVPIGSIVSGIGDAIVSKFKSSLGIHSPSLVMRGLGQQTGQGLILGLADSLPAVTRASGQLAASVAGGYAGAPGGHSGAQGGGVTIINHFHGVTTDQGTVRQLVQAVREYKRHGGGAALGIA
jgi:hypothetical protein